MYYAYPSWDDTDIGLLGNWGEIMFLVFSVPVTWLIQAHGPRYEGFSQLSALYKCEHCSSLSEWGLSSALQ